MIGLIILQLSFNTALQFFIFNLFTNCLGYYIFLLKDFAQNIKDYLIVVLLLANKQYGFSMHFYEPS